MSCQMISRQYRDIRPTVPITTRSLPGFLLTSFSFQAGAPPQDNRPFSVTGMYNTMMVKCQLYGRFNGDCRWKFMIVSGPALQLVAIEKGLVPVSPITPFSSRLQRTRRIQQDSQHPCMMHPKSMDPPALTADCPRKAAKRQS